MKSAFPRPALLLIGILLSLGLLMGWLTQRNQVNWERSYERESNEPFGSSLLFEQLPYLFPGAEVIPVQKKAFDQLVYQSPTHCLYIFINEDLPFYTESTRELLSFVAAGNYVFLGTYALPEALKGALQVRGGAPLNVMGLLRGMQVGEASTDSLWLALTYEPMAVSRFPERDAGYFWELPDKERGQILGKDKKGRLDFLELPYGKGRFFLHSHPNLFSNYYLLDSLRRPYLEAVLARLPLVDTVYWDEYYKKANLQFRPSERHGDGEEDDPPERPSLLAYMFTQPALAWGLGLAMIGLVLFGVFEAKRKQRVIPQIDPLPNSTLDFSETIGRLYFQNGNHLNLAKKRLRVLLEHLRSHYFLDTQHLDQEFITTLAGKTGLTEDEARELTSAIERVQRRADFTSEELVQFNRLVEAFYKKTKL